MNILLSTNSRLKSYASSVIPMNWSAAPRVFFGRSRGNSNLFSYDHGSSAGTVGKKPMRDIDVIAILGGGPAGAMAATTLAAAGRRVVLVDEKLVWEKPCGGGVTQKALSRYTFLRDAEVESNWVQGCELISPAGSKAYLRMERQIAIFSRRVLNGLLLQRAQQAGTELLRDRVTGIDGCPGQWQLRTCNANLSADYLILALGVKSAFRDRFSRPFTSTDLMAAVGYFVPGTDDHMQVRFLPGLEGYIWIFPRRDHCSAGICARMGTKSTKELRLSLEQYLRQQGVHFQGAPFFAHLLPSLSWHTLREARFSGEGWAMIGDAAGFVEPITGEGVYYALRSAELLCQALLAGRPEMYPLLLREDFLPELELAAGMTNWFFTGRVLGQAITECLVQLAAQSREFRELVCALFASGQYRKLLPSLLELFCAQTGATRPPLAAEVVQ